MTPLQPLPIRALATAIAALDAADDLLAAVQEIGVWSKSDDDSDNRQRRAGLREADWALARAHREIRACAAEYAAELAPIEANLARLAAFVEPLAERVTVTRDPDYELRRGVTEARERVSATRASVAHLLAMPAAEGAD